MLLKTVDNRIYFMDNKVSKFPKRNKLIKQRRAEETE